MTAPLLELNGVVKHFGTAAGTVRALDGVSLSVKAGETLGLVGESGCGKSTVARVAMRLLGSDAGRIVFDGQDVTHAEGAALHGLRARLQMVFQDPYASLNPRVTVGRALEEPLIVHRRAGKAERREQVAWALSRVGLRADMASRFPHEFSGGQRQRIGIARALMLRPELIVCDEAVSALDVSVRAQVLNLLLDVQREFGVSYLFISHDLSVVRHVSDRVAVMYLGQVVEMAGRDALWRAPLHPYTRALISAIPRARPSEARRQRVLLKGDLPGPLDPPSGCRFHTRCPQAAARCAQEVPVLREGAPMHFVACHFA
ncbi:ABC transporter ATP-binding protein [Cupriavidus sp. CuC1]|uniref:ABC transporter ATP-binding protein n=1 Tax=Cupriavidus sp. CuC1 TaxID=3373131 RepID=UPI0037D5DB97